MRSETVYQWLVIGLSIVAALLLGVFTYIEIFPQYKSFQNKYLELEEFKAKKNKTKLPPFKKGVKQIVLVPDDNGPETIDRCISCHLALKLKHFSPLIIIALLAYLFALSNNITLGTDIIAKYEVPSFLIFLTKIFRSSGRFVWILFYLISISSLIFIIKNYSDKTIKVILILLITIQFVDLSNAREYFSTKLNTPKIFNGRSGKWKSPMKNIIWNEISKNYNKVSYVYTKNRPKDYFPISYLQLKMI